jgi:hypothetical protein
MKAGGNVKFPVWKVKKSQALARYQEQAFVVVPASESRDQFVDLVQDCALELFRENESVLEPH